MMTKTAGDRGMDAKNPSDVIGDWGPIQIRILIFLTVCDIIAPFNNSSIIFNLQKRDFYCKVYNQTTGSVDLHLNTCQISSNKSSFKCSNFTYDSDGSQRNLVESFDLVCDRQWYGSFSQSMQQIGAVASGYLIGSLSDNFGRLKASRLAIVLEIIAGFSQAFSPNIIVFCVARFFTGFAGYGRFMTGYVLINEWMGPKSRPKAAIAYVCGSNVGGFLLPLAFYYYSDFRVMQAAVSTFEVVLLVLHLLLMLESPRWLLTHAKYKEAGDVLRKAAKAKKNLDEHEIECRIERLERNTAEAHVVKAADPTTCSRGVIVLLKSSNYRAVTLILFYTWMMQMFIGSASSFNISSLGGSIFLSFFIDSLSSSTTSSLVFLLIGRFSRKMLLKMTMTLEIIGLMALIGCSFQPELYFWRLAFHFVFNAGRSATNKVYHLYTAETFPTTMRQSAIGICSLFGSIGSTVAPFVKELNSITHTAVVLSIYLSMASVNLFLILFVPDTDSAELPDVIPESPKDREKG